MAVVSNETIIRIGVHFGHELEDGIPKWHHIFYIKKWYSHYWFKINSTKVEEAYNALLGIVQEGGTVILLVLKTSTKCN